MGHLYYLQKKDGKLRLGIDYRALNQNTIVDLYSFPCIDELLSRLWGAKYFSSLDLSGGYFHVPIANKMYKKQSLVIDMELVSI